MDKAKALISDSNHRDSLKWSVIGLLVGLGLLGNYYFMPQPLALRMAGLVILLILILFIGYHTFVGKKFWKFFREAYGELKKVVWPSRQETIRTTFVVLGIISVFAFMIWVVDLFLIWIINFLTGQV